ncbi:MAG: hypothetical protein VX278_04600, partial [Myxococcota bacterium]|nr:hypothetical protein [Myxococcota bacterium]
QDPATGPLPELRDVKTKPWDGTPLRSIIPELKENPKETKKPEGFHFEEEEDFMFEDLPEETQKTSDESKPNDTPKDTEGSSEEKPSEDTPKEEQP